MIPPQQEGPMIADFVPPRQEGMQMSPLPNRRADMTPPRQEGSMIADFFPPRLASTHRLPTHFPSCPHDPRGERGREAMR